jgi:hypothetical protein
MAGTGLKLFFDVNYTAAYQGVHTYIERRLIDLIKFLLLPRMGLLGSQARTKKINYEL